MLATTPEAGIFLTRRSMHMHAHTRTNTKNGTIAPRWLSLAEAGTYSGLSPQTLRNWAKAGHLTLHTVKVMGARGRTLIDREQLDALIIGFAGAPTTALAMNAGKEVAK